MLEIRLNNDLTEIERLVDLLEGYAEQHSLPAKQVSKMSIAMDEIVGNIIQYALDNPDTGQKIDVRIQSDGAHLEVTIWDPGPPFDPLQVAEPDTSLALEEREIGGIGIHMARRLMDDIAYQRVLDKNVLTLTININ